MRTARSRLAAAFAATLLSLLAPAGARATSVLALDLDAIVAAARHVVHVRCVGNEVQADPAVGAVTVTTFVVLDRAKGSGDATFAVRQAGGELDGMVIDYRVPSFRVGDEYVLFVPAPSQLGLASPVGLTQGVFGVVAGRTGQDVGNGQDFAELLPRDRRGDLPAGIAARLGGDRTERLRVSLADFMTLVRAKARGR